MTRAPFLAALVAATAGLACATRPTTGTASVNGTRLYYEIRGSGPTVVLLQGGQLPLEMWDDQFAFLARDFRVVRYDARGFGRSAPKSGPFESHEDLYGLMRVLGIARASLVGLSLGGRVAIDFALTHPEMVERMVLAGPGLSGFGWSGDREPWVDSAIAALNARDSVRVSLLWLQSGYMKPAMRDSTLARRLRELTVRNASLWMQPDSERVLEPPAVGRLSTIRIPTLVLIGTQEVPDIFRIVDTVVAAIPGARRVVIEGAGHMLNMERPAEFNRLVREFLRAPN
ncbi:MAG TPA: alpha/beta fold hydrolase [Gemmatimonadaceae bacterium]|nr:alpha/beta fold hydrolase [Gemmatimonadaceae bacterium]